MLLLLRKTLFYLLLATYLVVTPYLIFYGLGYGVNPKEGEIYKTGLVSVVTEPKGASIFLEDRKYSGKTPAAIGGLLPGQYHMRLVLKGFEPWQKTIEIVAEKATRLEPVVLLPRKSAAERIVEGTFEDLLPKGSDFKIFAFREKNLEGLVKIDLFFRKKTALHSSSKKTPLVPIEECKILPDAPEVLFKLKSQGNSGWLLYDLEREKPLADLTLWIPEKVELIDWDPKNPNPVYFLKKGQLTLRDTEEESSIIMEDILGVGARQRRLYYLKKDFTFWQANARGENAVPLTEKDGMETRIFPTGEKASYYQIDLLKRVLFQRDLFLFLGEDGSLLSNWPPYRLMEKGVRGYLHSVKGISERILFWTDREIGMFDFALNHEEEEALPPRILLYRSGQHIQQAFWAFDNTHVVFLDENEIFLLEAGETSPYMVRSLGSVAKGSHIFYHDRQHVIYYIDPQTKHLMRRKINE